MLFSKYTAALSAVFAVAAASADNDATKKFNNPHLPHNWMNRTSENDFQIEGRGFDCNNRVSGLNYNDCRHMSDIGMAGQGRNDRWNNGKIWIGNDAPNTFTFTNNAWKLNVPVTLVFWSVSNMWVDQHIPEITYSLPNVGDRVTISVANGVSGGFAALYNEVTTLSNGLVFNTIGEFTTGNYATVDVSREVNMRGNPMSIQVSGGCRSNHNECVFVCTNGQNQCGEMYTYDLINCGGIPNSGVGRDQNNQPSGGCYGWSNGGHIEVSFDLSE